MRYLSQNWAVADTEHVTAIFRLIIIKHILTPAQHSGLIFYIIIHMPDRCPLLDAQSHTVFMRVRPAKVPCGFPHSQYMGSQPKFLMRQGHVKLPRLVCNLQSSYLSPWGAEIHVTLKSVYFLM